MDGYKMKLTTRGRYCRLDSNKIEWILIRRNTHSVSQEGRGE